MTSLDEAALRVISQAVEKAKPVHNYIARASVLAELIEEGNAVQSTSCLMDLRRGTRGACELAAFCPLLVGARAFRACALPFSAKLVYPRRCRARAAHFSEQDSGTQLPLSQLRIS